MLDSREGLGNDGRAAGQAVPVMPDDCHTCHDILEGFGHLCLLVDEVLPCAGGTGVTSDGEVGLETHFSVVDA